MTTIIKRGRVLGAQDDVFSQNAWDDTEWTAEMRQEAEHKIEEQRKEAQQLLEHPNRISGVESGVTRHWDYFYATHEDKFFKDRRWIFSEFPEILPNLREDSGPCRIFEVGCGVGNAVAHIIKSNSNPLLHIYCCDLSPNAIRTLKGRDIYRQNEDKVTAFQTDICKAFDDDCDDEFSIKPSSLDFIMLIFTLSAMKPELMKSTIINLAKLLKPNGLFLLRDYARFDMTQLRFKGRSYLSENYYVRNDGTTSYFFTREILDSLFTSTGCLEKVELKTDNRLLVNRRKSLKMCRCWIQAKYKRI